MIQATKYGFGAIIGVALGMIAVVAVCAIVFTSCTAAVIRHETTAIMHHNRPTVVTTYTNNSLPTPDQIRDSIERYGPEWCANGKDDNPIIPESDCTPVGTNVGEGE